MDPQGKSNSLCTTNAAYGYKILAKNGVNSGSYVLVANAENGKGNIKTTAAWSTFATAESLSGSFVAASGT